MLGQTAEEMGFNENFMFSDLIVYNSSYPIDDLSAEDLAWSAIGQGRVLATPLHMALIASTIANRGVMNEPRLIAQVTTAQGGNRALLSHAGGRRVISEDVANRLESEMIRVVKTTEGTIVPATTGRMNGRGAYVCSLECLGKAMKNKGLSRSLKAEIPSEVYEQLKEAFAKIEQSK